MRPCDRLVDIDRQRAVALQGCVSGSHLALILARISQARRSRFAAAGLVAVTPDEEQARALVRDLAFFVGDDPHAGGPLHLPQVDSSPYAEISADRDAVQARMGVLQQLVRSCPAATAAGPRPPLVVGSAAALARRVISRDSFEHHSLGLQSGVEIDRDQLAARLIAAGFRTERIVEDPGTFAVRGGLIDIYPPLDAYPSRIELLSDLVESIRRFDPVSQRTLRAVDQVLIHPVHEAIRAPGVDPRTRILEAADAVSFPSRATRALLEEVDSGRAFFGIEALVPAFHRELVPVDEYLDPDALWVVVDPAGVQAALEAADEQAEAAFRARSDSGRLAFAPSAFFVPAAQLLARIADRRQLQVPRAGGTARSLPAPAEVVLVEAADNLALAAELQRARSERGEEILAALVARIVAWRAGGHQVVIAGGSAAQLDRLDALLRAHRVEARRRAEAGTPYLLDDAQSPLGREEERGELWLQAGDLGAGLRCGDLVLIAEEEIFGPKVRRQPARHGGAVRPAGRPLTDLRQLRPGDHVVHSLHGIGIYRGLVQLAVACARGGDDRAAADSVPADFLQLEYAGADRLYLPVYRMDQVQRYVGGGAAAEGAGPGLDRLGGLTWARKRRRVEHEVRRFGEELLQLYAQRAALAGHAYDEPDALYAEFEASFPFSETPDQQRAVAEVVADLTAPRPMDRLVCGDVGFGKTEVALRAAFQVAMSGRQVALLAPTTVLVEQHHRTFTERMTPYPLVVAALSRFCAPPRTRQVLAGLAGGTVDVVIGTHRLLSRDVRFADLGLVVIDEEQRFGVAHKERLKRLRTQVDVLTMTATPIPRTLQLSMVGLREISVIATPPADRLAVRTFVCRFDEALVREAIQKELDRGGQVFFVHNRVETIEQRAAELRRLLPRARVAVGHGQLDSRRLERVMLDFVAGQHDVLVCSTIIESGLDIPRANTMFVDRADHFGLAQLYQLRGRIGRSRQRAFCYLLVPGVEALAGEARARLATLEQFTQLGSGFSVATHDLEIRGAGDLLGRRQSGHIAAVGFETYARILEEAVAELKGEPIHRDSDPEINVGVAAYIPDDYVEDTGQRLELYQRLSSAARDEEQVGELLAEIADRYGPRPHEVDALGVLMVVKGLAARLKARQVDLSATRLSLTLDETTPLDPQRVAALVSDRRSRFRLTAPQPAASGSIRVQLIRELDAGERRRPLAAARQTLHWLLAQATG